MPITPMIQRIAIYCAFVLSVALTTTEAVAQDQFYTDAWGFDYEEARWDFITNGAFNSRIFVGTYEGNAGYYFGMMRNSFDPVVELIGASVEFADGSVRELSIGNCSGDRCLNQYDDQYGAPGTYLEIPIAASDVDGILSALKSGSYIAFRYQTVSSAKKRNFKINTLSLKGSRKALEQLQRSYEPVATPRPKTTGQPASVAHLMDVFNNNWWFASGTGGRQDASQRFIAADEACTYHGFVEHPNTGKTTYEVNFSSLDPSRIEWPDDPFKDEKLPFVRVATLGARETVKEWIDYPDGTSEAKRTAKATFYVPLTFDFDLLRLALSTAILGCIRG